PESVRLLIDSADEIMVIAPELPDRTHWLVSDTDKAKMAADERLATVLGHLEGGGKEASGEVGAGDPLLAFEDGVADLQPDHMLIALRSADHAGWQERGLTDEVVHRFGLPVTVFTI